ncbi:MAG: M23 family metallopeptidase [Oceanipulchritudo sp.]
MRFRLTLLFLVNALHSGHGEAPVWPVPGEAFSEGRPYAEFVQPTASGNPESALFGCVRNNGNRFHEALDIAPVLERQGGEATDPVGAIHAGRVVHINRVAGNSSYGRYVVMEHPGLTPAIYSLYAHLARIPERLESGVFLEAGETLGIMGRSAGGYHIPRSRAHLHLEVGLRLTRDFQDWYDRQGYTSRNQHGNFNGMNLIGWDPLDYFTAWRDGEVASLEAYFERIPPGLVLHLRTSRYPDFLERYPYLKRPGCPEGERAGWEVTLSPWGLPLGLRGLRDSELLGAVHPGEISVIAINEDGVGAYGCRNLTVRRNGNLYLGSGGRRVLELLFNPG